MEEFDKFFGVTAKDIADIEAKRQAVIDARLAARAAQFAARRQPAAARNNNNNGSDSDSDSDDDDDSVGPIKKKEAPPIVRGGVKRERD